MKQVDFAQFEFEPVKCYICGEDNTNELHKLPKKYKEGPLRFVECKNDGLIYQNPAPTHNSLKDFFNSQSFTAKKETLSASELTGYFDYLAGEKFRMKMAKERLKKINKSFGHKKNLKILKIAPGTGIFLKLAKDHGHDVTGIDISAYFVEYAIKHHNLKMINAAFQDHDFKDQKFDLILFYGAVMNISDPNKFLDKINALLNPEGQMHINFISSKNWVYKIQKANFWLIRPPVLSYFNSDNFQKLLANTNFNIKSIKKEWQYTNLSKLINFSKIGILIKALNLLKLHNLIVKIPIPGGRYVIASKK